MVAHDDGRLHLGVQLDAGQAVDRLALDYGVVLRDIEVPGGRLGGLQHEFRAGLHGYPDDGHVVGGVGGPRHGVGFNPLAPAELAGDDGSLPSVPGDLGDVVLPHSADLVPAVLVLQGEVDADLRDDLYVVPVGVGEDL